MKIQFDLVLQLQIRIKRHFGTETNNSASQKPLN